MTERKTADTTKLGSEQPDKPRPAHRVGAVALKQLFDKKGRSNLIITGYHSKVPPDFRIEPGTTVGQYSEIGPGCRSESGIGQLVRLGEGVTIAAGCIVGTPSARRITEEQLLPNLEDTELKLAISIGNDVVIATGVTIHNNTQIGDRVTVGKKVVIGQPVKKANTTVIADGVAIEKGAVIEAGAYIGVGYYIQPGTVVSSDVVLQDHPAQGEEPVSVDEKYLRENGYSHEHSTDSKKRHF